mmetsp:Transcript_3437/g.4268  ORF Transcript_3437/g.4268 Transcript_3437/m.4268 type:complete len:90 (+) Transcript_3437:47-316(+)
MCSGVDPSRALLLTEKYQTLPSLLRAYYSANTEAEKMNMLAYLSGERLTIGAHLSEILYHTYNDLSSPAHTAFTQTIHSIFPTQSHQFG